MRFSLLGNKDTGLGESDDKLLIPLRSYKTTHVHILSPLTFVSCIRRPTAL
jgi:hypothetical protein